MHLLLRVPKICSQRKAEQPLQGMGLQEKEAQKDKSIQEIALKEPTVNTCLSTLYLKPFRSQVKGKYCIGREFQSLAVRGKKLLT